jgi:hypothetical protein
LATSWIRRRSYPSQVDPTQYRALLAGDRIIVTSRPESNRIVATSVQRVKQ